MIIEETEERYELEVYEPICGGIAVYQGGDFLLIDKHQAAQLVVVLQKWINGEEIE